MPKPRNSLVEFARSGTLQRHPGHYASRLSGGIVLTSIGRPPGYLNANEKVTWAEIVKTAPPGLLTKHDRIALEIVVKMVIRMRTTQVKASELSP
jgi:hypothetical protein